MQFGICIILYIHFFKFNIVTRERVLEEIICNTAQIIHFLEMCNLGRMYLGDLRFAECVEQIL